MAATAVTALPAVHSKCLATTALLLIFVTLTSACSKEPPDPAAGTDATEAPAPEATNVIAPTAESMLLSRRPNRVSVQATVANQEAADSLTQLARSLLAASDTDPTIDSDYTVTAVRDDWQPLMLAALSTGLRLDYAEVHIANDAMTFRGIATSAHERDAVLQTLADALPATIQLSHNIEVITPHENPGVLCQQQFNSVLRQQRVGFQVASATINGNSFSLLDELLEIAGDCPDANIQVVGHTDAGGDEQFNIELSLQRANAIKAYLVEHGMRPARLSVRGAGPSEPIDDNGTATGRRNNRRIEFLVLNN